LLLAWCSTSWTAEEPIPAGAQRWRNVLLREVRYAWGWREDASPWFSQVHQESRWVETARSRFASGLTQFTPATARGVQQSEAGLRQLCADAGGCPFEPRWALRAMTLYDRRLWDGIKGAADDMNRRAFTLMAYNAGPGWVARERAKCYADREMFCQGGRWFGHVEQMCLRAAWACRETQGYVHNILERWRPMYAEWLYGRTGRWGRWAGS
jgi:soluble lytic murein transglycosylase-like protein